MPQLNPEPWLTILIFSWLMFLILVPFKVLAHTFPNEHQAQDKKESVTEPWNWPWH
uniref:ATP synthase complex subunit 8 n=2 Tax=Cetomimidae TaxID=88666 RepID=B9ECP1_9TELE|nr:ATP synthase F0 subunit 8 [Eutaeniophorus festivus]YP_002586807.1 ATP synthase F0 subunit 8 [Ataxolepis apus]BAH15276.1 ATPase subunit 8 [Eutaeniophorus festivus]BAH15302.1 ATPase subunit 8 [Ataxolepis apus]